LFGYFERENEYRDIKDDFLNASGVFSGASPVI